MLLPEKGSIQQNMNTDTYIPKAVPLTEHLLVRPPVEAPLSFVCEHAPSPEGTVAIVVAVLAGVFRKGLMQLLTKWRG